MYNRQKVDNYKLHKAWNIHLHKLLMAKAQQFHIDLDKRSASSTTLAIILIFYLLISKSGLNLNTGGEKTHTLRQLEGCHKLLNLKPIWCMQFQTRQFFILSIKFHKCQGMASIGERRDNSTILSHYYGKEKKKLHKIYREKKKEKFGDDQTGPVYWAIQFVVLWKGSTDANALLSPLRHLTQWLAWIFTKIIRNLTDLII